MPCLVLVTVSIVDNAFDDDSANVIPGACALYLKRYTCFLLDKLVPSMYALHDEATRPKYRSTATSVRVNWPVHSPR
jgi:hypothetical protein